MRVVVLVALLGGCSFQGPSSAEGPCTVHDLELGMVCAGPELEALSINAYLLIDTTTGEVVDGADLVQSLGCVDADLNGRDVCAMWLNALNVDAEVRIIGDRPLLVVTTGELRVRDGGSLLAGSGDFGGVDAPGPGANAVDCDGVGTGAEGDPVDDPKQTWGGGGGGGFATSGGDGGTGRSGGAAGGPGGMQVAVPTALRGGCPGGAGGAIPEAGRGGDGGGALYLASLLGEIRNDGVISAVGGGGGGATPVVQMREPGGGGGGSGGMVVIDGPFRGLGQISVNGGGGGGGAEADGNGQPGSAGAPGDTGDQPASGGSGGNGNDGGDGATTTSDAQPGTSNDDGGGGGGGGLGYVIRTEDT